MIAAMSVVKGGASIKRTAEEHEVPASPLRDRISGHVVHGTKPGSKPYLSNEKEAELSSFLRTCSNIGYGRTRSNVLDITRSVAAEKGVIKGSKVTQGWWRHFCELQPDLLLCHGDVTVHVQMDAVNSGTLQQYFTSLNYVSTEHNLHSSLLKYTKLMRVVFRLTLGHRTLWRPGEPRKFITDLQERRGRPLLWVVLVLLDK